MLPAALAALAMAAGIRAAYPKLLEYRQRRRRRVGPEGIVIGAEPIDLPNAGAPAVLLVHGGGDTPQVLAEMAVHLHRRGFAVRVPLLAGHGRSLDALAAVSARDWHEDVRREYAALRANHAWVGIVGLSMGGALALSFAAEHHDVPALVLLAPYIAMPPVIRRLATAAGAWGWLLPYFSSRGGRSIHDPDAAARALGHGILTPAALRALHDVVAAAEQALPRVRAPALVIQSREDNRIAPEDAEFGFRRLGSAAKRFIWVDGAGHVITVDYGRQRVFELSGDWLQRHASRARS